MESTIEFGNPAAIIVNSQTDCLFHLVVMATYGRSGLKHLVLGSVAETIGRESRVRVLTIRPAYGRAS